jgi:cell shape-determining protein MreC
MSNANEVKLNSPWYVIQVLAASASLEKSDEWAWRKITREYSQKYNVPLDEVRKKPFKEVLYEVFEGRLDDVNRSNIFERIRFLLEDEEANKRSEEERIKRYEEEEKERLKKLATRKPKHKKQKIVSNIIKQEPILSKNYSMGNPDEE